jgi:cytochrome P450
MSDERHFDIVDPAVQQCPYKGYQQLSRTAPLCQLPSTGSHLVSQYNLTSGIIRAPDAFPSSVSPMALSHDGIAPEFLLLMGLVDQAISSAPRVMRP